MSLADNRLNISAILTKIEYLGITSNVFFFFIGTSNVKWKRIKDVVHGNTVVEKWYEVLRPVLFNSKRHIIQ